MTVLWPRRELKAMADFLNRGGGPGGGDRKIDGDDRL